MSEQGREVFVAMKNAVKGDAYALAFEGCFSGLRVISCATLDEAKKVLRKNPEACILIDLELAGGGISGLFLDHATLAKRALILVFGGDPSLLPPGADSGGVHFLAQEPALKDLVAKMEDVFRLAALAVQYCKMSPQSLRMRSRKLPCDLYLKLSEEKYVKVMNAADEFGQEAFQRFFAKNVQFLYLPRSGFLGIMDEVIEEANTLNLNPDRITVEGAADAANAIFHSVNSLFEVDGFTPQVQAMTMVSVNLAKNTLKKNPKLSELLSKLDANRDSFLSWHSTALSFLSCKLATALDWKSESTFYKLSLASLLHDLSLPRDDMAKFHDGCGAGGEKFSAEESEIIRRHPLVAAQLLSGMDDVPGEVSFIVEQHHENAEGTGYPKGVGTKDISSIAALFIIAHDLVNAMYRVPAGTFQMEKYMLQCETEKRFTRGAFGQVFRGIMSKLKDL